MATKQKTADDAVAEFQRQTHELLRAQQEAYLAAVKAWREGLDKGASPPWPQPSWLQPPSDAAHPNLSELAQASYAFAAKLLADQSRFMEELSKSIAGETKK